MGFLHLVLEEGVASGHHDLHGLRLKVVDGGFLIQSSLDAGDGCVVMGACLLDGVQA